LPITRFTGFRPPTALVVLDHQPLKFGVEPRVVDLTGVTLVFEFGVAAVRLLEAYLAFFEVHYVSLYRSCQVNDR
jgi:hypothetical protein